MAAPAPPPGGDKKNIVKMAYIYFQEGRWDKAIEEYKKLLALDPEDINAHNMLGDVYVKKGAMREAYQEYVKVADDFSSRGQSEKAAIVNKKIASLDTDKLPSDAQQKQALIRQVSRAETAMEQEDFDTALEAYKGILKIDPENLQAHGKLAEILAKKGDNSEAVTHFLEVGVVFVKNRLYKKAQEIYQKVVDLDPNNSEARASLAQIYIKQGSESDAKKEYLNLAEAAFNEGDMDKAQQYSAKAIEFKSIEAHYIMGLVLLKKQKYAEAKSEFENLLRFKVNHVGALTNLALVFLEQNQPDKANEFIQKAVKAEKNNPRTLEVLAEFHIKKNAKIEAVATLLSLVDLYAEKKEHAKASEMALKAIGVDPSSLQAHIKLADMYRIQGMKDKAAEVFSKTGSIFEAQGKKDQADEYYKKALEMDPQNAEAAKRAPASAAPPPPSPSTPAAPPVVPEVPAAPPPIQHKGAVLDLEKDLGEAPPSAPPVVANVEEPKAPPAPAIDLEAEFQAQLEIADNLLKQGLVEEAIDSYQQLIEQYPDKPKARERLNNAYTVYVKSGDQVLDALEAEKKQREEEDRRTRAEMEKRIREEADKKVQAEVERKAREDAEKKAREEAARKTREEAEKKAREEAEHKAREEADQKARVEMERRAKEEAEKKAREEAEKKTREEAERHAKEEAEKKAREAAERHAKEETEKKAREEADRLSREAAAKAKPVIPGMHAKSPVSPDEPKDDFMTIAVADIYVRQGLQEEALKIYKKILLNEPDNFEARKKLTDLESQLKGKAAAPPPPPPPPADPAAPASSAAPGPKPDGEPPKKRTSKVGYV